MIVILTSSGDPKDLQHARELGAVDWKVGVHTLRLARGDSLYQKAF